MQIEIATQHPPVKDALFTLNGYFTFNGCCLRGFEIADLYPDRKKDDGAPVLDSPIGMPRGPHTAYTIAKNSKSTIRITVVIFNRPDRWGDDVSSRNGILEMGFRDSETMPQNTSRT